MINIKRTVFDHGGLLLFALWLLVLVSFFGISSDSFLSINTFSTISNQIASTAIMATGMTFIILIGCIDLSIGSLMACCSVTLAIALTRWNLPSPAAILLTIAVGTALGFLNGSIIVKWGLSPFIVTLGTMEIYRGAAFLLSGSRTMYISSAIDFSNTKLFAGVSLSFLIALLVVILFECILRWSVFGRYVVGIGTNEEAMRLSGVSSRIIKPAVFALSGALSAIAAVFESARMEAADPNTGSGLELYVIAAVAIGGTSLRGGEGSVWASLLGVIVIAVLEAGLSQLGASEPVKRVLTGTVILTAIIFDVIRNPKNRTAPSEKSMAAR